MSFVLSVPLCSPRQVCLYVLFVLSEASKTRFPISSPRGYKSRTVGEQGPTSTYVSSLGHVVTGFVRVGRTSVHVAFTLSRCLLCWG